jgi:hypothetical protein
MSKRKYAKKNPLVYVPTAYSFTSLETEQEDGEFTFDVGDNGSEVEGLIDKTTGAYTLLDILYNLTDREKMVFLIQLCREFGYEIDHGSFAKALGIHRVHYMSVLRSIRHKVEQMPNTTIR